ncbi:Methyltransferase domain-containing protein [Pseudomonas asturiensis]|uniref:Class I SAM-dependent methyltransferase n=3 Tax=Pseudomonas TaxID=286 RepID=A0A1M7Q8A6_9PSED|nr:MULTISPECIES: class I SAM-dependent methyltransferase [Pseudomonas]MBC3956871.1 class I SAM-dependent methyltransferase [Pseudomonas triticifolii]QHF05922.1 class I SAM-dependent methyltransferase [Pseudomonas asturiensis]SHN26491.1 Methyltransferase domain-containing protein [Pseudomonas asturiensis]
MIVNGDSFNIINPELFKHSLEGLRQSVATPDSFYSADNVICWNRNFSFMTDEPFMAAMRKNATSNIEMSIIWRTYILCHFAKMARRLPGDFVEVGAYKGNTANVIADRVDLASTGKQYYLYDAFEHDEGDVHHAMPNHGPQLHNTVKERFAAYPFVQVIKGYVPDSFEQGFPEQIAFAHIDLNQAPAEVEALKRIVPRMVPGSVLILDDYGWWVYRAQKEAEDPLLAEFGLEVLELPTGQGLVFKL